jgi:hypothetical protein
MRRLIPIVIVVSLGIAIAAAQDSPKPAGTVPLTVHEWGTFTSIAGPDGTALSWLPQAGPTDLPCFVERNLMNVKGSLTGTVRMETPVLYFYAPRDVTVRVSVGFRQGVITEWFPKAQVGTTPTGSGYDGTIAWPEVNVLPRHAAEFPVETGARHYYKARNTSASPLQSGSQMERFLFYRGVGTFAPPISATVQTDSTTLVWNSRGIPIGDVILFENRRGALAYNVRHVAGDRVTLERPELDDASAAPLGELVQILVANGLYREEAEAMVDTWSDSWFEEGARLLYIVPRPAVDAILPLQIAPVPTDVARVFVGRMELVTPETRRDVGLALATNDRVTLEKYGRFLQPIGERVVAAASPIDRTLLSERLAAAAPSWLAPAPSCR